LFVPEDQFFRRSTAMHTITLYNGMGEVTFDGPATLITKVSSGDPKWERATIEDSRGIKLHGYLRMEEPVN
jgi:hypothetical protein